MNIYNDPPELERGAMPPKPPEVQYGPDVPAIDYETATFVNLLDSIEYRAHLDAEATAGRNRFAHYPEEWAVDRESQRSLPDRPSGSQVVSLGGLSSILWSM